MNYAEKQRETQMMGSPQHEVWRLHQEVKALHARVNGYNMRERRAMDEISKYRLACVGLTVICVGLVFL